MTLAKDDYELELEKIRGLIANYTMQIEQLNAVVGYLEDKIKEFPKEVKKKRARDTV